MTGLSSGLVYFKKRYFPEKLTAKEKKILAAEKELERPDILGRKKKARFTGEARKLWNEVEKKHHFYLPELMQLPKDELLNLVTYLEKKENVEDAFNLMVGHKKAHGKDEKYKELKEAWEGAKEDLAVYQLEEDIDSKKIDKADTVPKFIRKYNLGILTQDHNLFLRKVLENMLKGRKKRGVKKKAKKARPPKAKVAITEAGSLDNLELAEEEIESVVV